jgi:hypothetical protein
MIRCAPTRERWQDRVRVGIRSIAEGSSTPLAEVDARLRATIAAATSHA